MKVYSDDFKDGGRMPDRHAYARENESPSLRWSDLPEGTKEVAIICEDPDAPGGTWVHWVLYGLAADTGGLEPGVPKWQVLHDLGNAKQGKNDFKKFGFDGPHPPPGAPHRYFFRVYALNDYLTAGAGLSAAQLRQVIEDKIIDEAETFGTYSR